MTLREMFYNDIKGYTPKKIKKIRKINKTINGDKGIDWGTEDSNNFDQRDK